MKNDILFQTAKDSCYYKNNPGFYIKNEVYIEK